MALQQKTLSNRTVMALGVTRDTVCCSASLCDPPVSKRINMLPRRSASNLRA